MLYGFYEHPLFDTHILNSIIYSMLESSEIPTPIQFRIATPQDVETIMQIDEKAYPHDPNFQARQECNTLEEQLTLEGKIAQVDAPRSYLALRGSNPVGYMLIKAIGKETMLVTDWATLPEYRNATLAFSMIEHLLSMGKKKFSFELYARENTSHKLVKGRASQEFIIKHGYQAMDDVATPPITLNGEVYRYIRIQPNKTTAT